ncbi:polymorphic toxin-type HINT domain-containing protein [Brevibacillus reuszeri]|uniref:polymorphic toxin-type HINT domain-containing protein n=1 Tax=Brevibacillus reuszeri TaxID=54915 RepID=UPI001F1B1791|nr:polymorphic toxin-type HINT domain-containing protein [Brevibacillus reuszeri]MED1856753.1 polymorphic toxin-type HINT domain-containing protein [Brevibacillus reuszeri]
MSNNPLRFVDPTGHVQVIAGDGATGTYYYYDEYGVRLIHGSKEIDWDYYIEWYSRDAAGMDKAMRGTNFGQTAVASAIYFKWSERIGLPPVSASQYTGSKFLKPKNQIKANANVKDCNCFTAGTKVLTDEGEKPIEDIEVGDKVLAKDDETGEMAYKEVEWLFQREVEETYNITVGGEVISTTDEHPFWVVGKGWVEAKYLIVGDVLTTSNEKELAIEKIEVKNEHKIVYNFKVKDFHTYFVSNLGVWTHNSCGYKTNDKTKGGLVFTEHGAERANERGFTADVIDSIVQHNKKNRFSKVDAQGRKTWEYVDSRGNKVVLNEQGGIVSVHSPAEGGVYIPKPKKK